MTPNISEILLAPHNLTDQDVPVDLETTRFVVQKVMVPIVTGIGLIGNLLNIFVLRHPYMKEVSTNFYLFVLCLADMLYLILSLCLSFKRCSDQNQHVSSYYFIVYGRPLTDLSGNIAVWITVVFTIERYIGVRFPLKGKVWCTVRKARIISLVTFMFCVINTFPEFFEKEVVTSAAGEHHCRYTTFSDGSSYQIGYYWWFVTIFTFIPLSFLFIFNVLLILSVIAARKNRGKLLRWESRAANIKYKREQYKITLMLVTIVIIFLLCQLPWTVLLIYRTYLSEYRLPTPITDLRIAGNVCNLLVQINASVNFYLYSFFSHKFRCTLKKIICICQVEQEKSAAI